MASLSTKVCMLDIKHYSGVGYPKIHLRLYGIVMRAKCQTMDSQWLFSPCHLVEQCRDGLPQFGLQDSALRKMWLMSFLLSSLLMLILICPYESQRPPDRGQTSSFLHFSVVRGQRWSVWWTGLRSRIILIWLFGTYNRGLLDTSWAFHSKLSRVWFRQLSVLRSPLLKDYGQILFISLIVRGKGQLDHLKDLERLTLLATSIKGLHITHIIGILQLELISFILSLTWPRLVCSCKRHL